MTLAYVTHPMMAHEVGSGVDLYERHEVVRDLYRQVTEWTGIDVERLLREGPEAELAAVAPVCQALLSLAVHDVLASLGIRPQVLAGMSLGNVVGACMAGAIDRRELFVYLAETSAPQQMLPRVPGREAFPDGDGRGGEASTVIMLAIPFDQDPAAYALEAGGGALHLVSDMGPADPALKYRRVCFGGLRSDVDKYLAELPAEQQPFAVTDVPLTPHSPLRQAYVDEVIDPLLDTMTFSDPDRPVVSCLDRADLTTGEQVRTLLRENHLRAASLPFISDGLERHGVSAYFVVGPSIAGRYAKQLTESKKAGEIPMIPVENLEQLQAAIEALYELNVDLGVAA